MLHLVRLTKCTLLSMCVDYPRVLISPGVKHTATNPSLHVLYQEQKVHVHVHVLTWSIVSSGDIDAPLKFTIRRTFMQTLHSKVHAKCIYMFWMPWMGCEHTHVCVGFDAANLPSPEVQCVPCFWTLLSHHTLQGGREGGREGESKLVLHSLECYLTLQGGRERDRESKPVLHSLDCYLTLQGGREGERVKNRYYIRYLTLQGGRDGGREVGREGEEGRKEGSRWDRGGGGKS